MHLLVVAIAIVHFAAYPSDSHSPRIHVLDQQSDERAERPSSGSGVVKVYDRASDMP